MHSSGQKTGDILRKSGVKRGRFLLCTCIGTGYKRVSAGFRDFFPETCGKDNRLFRECEDAALGNVGNFSLARRFGFCAYRRAHPVFPPANGLPTASQGAETGLRAFCFRRQCRGFCAEPEEPRCEIQGKRQDEGVVDGGVGGAFAGGVCPVRGRNAACVPGRGKNGGST